MKSNATRGRYKGAAVVKGVYLSADTEGGIDRVAGRHALRIGDGYHDYILASFVSCMTDAIPPGATVVGAALTLHTSRVYGMNPFNAGDATIKVDVVRALFSKALLAACCLCIPFPTAS